MIETQRSVQPKDYKLYFWSKHSIDILFHETKLELMIKYLLGRNPDSSSTHFRDRKEKMVREWAESDLRSCIIKDCKDLNKVVEIFKPLQDFYPHYYFHWDKKETNELLSFCFIGSPVLQTERSWEEYQIRGKWHQASPQDHLKALIQENLVNA